ncbi:MAG: pyruvate dehydrogenase E2 component (dihydrolipoamide acetyltransferase) [Oleispira sp.]|jgi:pyruvate dehydrogenase E2 component (dihydrolipoamide acetyltransferase)
MTIESLTVPDLGGAEQVEVIEILVAAGDQVAAEEGIIVLETDKATMEIPSPFDGTISSLSLKIGDKLNEGDQYGEIETGVSGSSSAADSDALTKPEDQQQEIINSNDEKTETVHEPVSDSDISVDLVESSGSHIEIISVPDLGGADQVEVIELLVKIGEEVDAEQSVLTLETDKASMEIPAGKAGRIEKILLTLGDTVSVGDAMIELRVSESSLKPEPEPSLQTTEPPAAVRAPKSSSVDKNDAPKASAQVDDSKPSGKVHAGPAVRKLARELGVDLSTVQGKGVRGRVTKDDVQHYVKNTLQNPTVSGSGIPKVATVDFSKFGEIETAGLNKIKLATAKNMTAAWLNVPQVTQFDQADITELEAFRKQINSRPNTEQKLSAVPFVMKALARAMKEFPQFNASLSPNGQSLIYKKYLNIGVAVDTPNGLLVPVIRDVDKKSITEIAKDLTDKAQRARTGKLGLADMQGGCLSVSSLGGIGGTAFTPIVNAPEVAILGLSRAEMKPVWNGSDFVPKLMLPLSLSYDHRVIDGAEAARFSQRLVVLLGDIRHLIL